MLNSLKPTQQTGPLVFKDQIQSRRNEKLNRRKELEGMDVDKTGFIEDLHKRNSDALGFIPRTRIKEYENEGRTLIQFDKKEPVGFLLFGKAWPYLNIYQACIEYDVRRQHFGMELVDRLEKKAKQNHTGIYLRCRENLEANKFWKKLGYQIVKKIPGGKKRGKEINLWIRNFSNPRQMELFSDLV